MFYEQYKKELQYYLKTGNITSMLLFAVALNKTGEFTKDFAEDFEEWKRLNIIIDEINLKIEEFNKTCWPDIKDKNNKEEKLTTFKFNNEKASLISRYVGGRILITISP